jgi:hypothetical protein
MTLTAIAAPLPAKVEVRIPLKRLLPPNVIFAGLLVLVIITMIVAAVWSITRLLPGGLSPGFLAFSSTDDCRNGLEYCSSLTRWTITGPFNLQLYCYIFS